VKVLAYAGQTKVLKKVGGISVDGSKIAANASKHAAVSYDYAQRMITELEKEVRALTAKAEKIDNKPLEDGLRVPDEIARRQERKDWFRPWPALIVMRAKSVMCSPTADFTASRQSERWKKEADPQSMRQWTGKDIIVP